MEDASLRELELQGGKMKREWNNRTVETVVQEEKEETGKWLDLRGNSFHLNTQTRCNKSIYRAFPEAGRSQSAFLRRQAILDHRHRFVDWRWSSRYSTICPWMKSIRPLKKRGRPGSSFRTNDRCLYIIYTQAWLADPIRSTSFLRIGKTKGRNDRILLACVAGDVFKVGGGSWTGGYETLVSRSMPRSLMSLINCLLSLIKETHAEMPRIDFNGIPRNATRRNMLRSSIRQGYR